MTPGCQLLSAVMAEVTRSPERLVLDFDVAVLLVVTADFAADGATAVTSPGRAFSQRQSSAYVVPLQPRFAKPPGDTRLSFGRSAVCDVMLPFSALSKHHGYFASDAHSWAVVDVGSTNGTSVDGTLLEPNTACRLQDGASLHFGQVSARFLLGPSFVQVLQQGRS